MKIINREKFLKVALQKKVRDYIYGIMEDEFDIAELCTDFMGVNWYTEGDSAAENDIDIVIRIEKESEMDNKDDEWLSESGDAEYRKLIKGLEDEFAMRVLKFREAVRNSLEKI